jgi:hypothetical protein
MRIVFVPERVKRSTKTCLARNPGGSEVAEIVRLRFSPLGPKSHDFGYVPEMLATHAKTPRPPKRRERWLTDADGSLRIRSCRWELEENHGKLV